MVIHLFHSVFHTNEEKLVNTERIFRFAFLFVEIAKKSRKAVWFKRINPLGKAKNNKVKAKSIRPNKKIIRIAPAAPILRRGITELIKGINRQVVEITETQCEYFERVLFFIKPEFSAVSEGDLKERATAIAQSAGMPPAARLRKNRLRLALHMGAAAFAGAAISGGIFLAVSFI